MTRPDRSGWCPSTPVSSTATVTPLPREYFQAREMCRESSVHCWPRLRSAGAVRAAGRDGRAGEADWAAGTDNTATATLTSAAEATRGRVRRGSNACTGSPPGYRLRASFCHGLRSDAHAIECPMQGDRDQYGPNPKRCVPCTLYAFRACAPDGRARSPPRTPSLAAIRTAGPDSTAPPGVRAEPPLVRRGPAGRWVTIGP